MKGLDISFSSPSQRWWEDRRDEGFQVMVQNLWTGGFASNKGILAVAATNLQRARLAGFKIAGYANASPPDWWSLKIQMDNIKANAGAEWGNIKDVVIDVEIPGITQARVMELADALEAAGKVADVLYTARWFWTGHMGNSKSIAWRRFRLWPADYDGDPTIDFPAPYGPWKVNDLIGKQYAGTTYINRQAVDLNTFKDSWLAPLPPEPEPPPEPPKEEDVVIVIIKAEDKPEQYILNTDGRKYRLGSQEHRAALNRLEADGAIRIEYRNKLSAADLAAIPDEHA